MKETMVVEPTAQSDGMSTIHVDRVEVIVREANKEGAPLAESQMKVLRNELEVQNWLDPLMSLMRAAGNDTRIRILYLLWRRGEVRVNDLATILGLTTPAISQQLKKLRECGIVLTRRDAQTIYYRLNASSEFVACLVSFFKGGREA